MSSKSDDWQIEQQSLTGETHTGQATLDGGVAKDALEDDIKMMLDSDSEYLQARAKEAIERRRNNRTLEGGH